MTGGYPVAYYQAEVNQAVSKKIPVIAMAQAHGWAYASEITIDKVLLLSTDGGVQVGAPYVNGATVTAKVVRQGKGKKIEGFTFKAKKNERRRFGHRQYFTELVVQSISG